MSTFDLKKFLINEGMTRVSRDRKRLYEDRQQWECPWAEAKSLGLAKRLKVSGEESLADEIKDVFYEGQWPDGDTDETVQIVVSKGDPVGAFDCFTLDEFMDLSSLEGISPEDLDEMSDLIVEVWGLHFGITIYGKSFELDPSKDV